LTNKPGKEFSAEFLAEYGWNPGAVAAFSYDAINILFNAIEKSGSEQSQIKKNLQQTNFEGVSGHISFDKNGNRNGSNGLIFIKDGLINPVEK
jgi:branched-chain amino acid transport system substrate-binding protein